MRLSFLAVCVAPLSLLLNEAGTGRAQSVCRRQACPDGDLIRFQFGPPSASTITRSPDAQTCGFVLTNGTALHDYCPGEPYGGNADLCSAKGTSWVSFCQSSEPFAGVYEGAEHGGQMSFVVPHGFNNVRLRVDEAFTTYVWPTAAPPVPPAAVFRNATQIWNQTLCRPCPTTMTFPVTHGDVITLREYYILLVYWIELRRVSSATATTAEFVEDCARAPLVCPTHPPTALSSTPTLAPTVLPTVSPSRAPSSAPSAAPTALPATPPTAAPTATPTVLPTASPSSAPSPAPSTIPTPLPTVSPTATPATSPTESPTVVSLGIEPNSGGDDEFPLGVVVGAVVAILVVTGVLVWLWRAARKETLDGRPSEATQTTPMFVNPVHQHVQITDYLEPHPNNTAPPEADYVEPHQEMQTSDYLEPQPVGPNHTDAQTTDYVEPQAVALGRIALDDDLYVCSPRNVPTNGNPVSVVREDVDVSNGAPQYAVFGVGATATA